MFPCVSKGNWRHICDIVHLLLNVYFVFLGVRFMEYWMLWVGAFCFLLELSLQGTWGLLSLRIRHGSIFMLFVKCLLMPLGWLAGQLVLSLEVSHKESYTRIIVTSELHCFVSPLCRYFFFANLVLFLGIWLSFLCIFCYLVISWFCHLLGLISIKLKLFSEYWRYK